MILLDTCVLLWLAADQTRLSARAIELIRDRADSLFVSAITAFELGIKQKKGRLTLPLPADRYYSAAVATHGVREIPIDGAIAARSTTLPDVHADPADRIIVSTAQLHLLTILTPDPIIRDYPDTRLEW